MALGFYDGTVRLVSLDDVSKELYCSSIRGNLQGPTFLNVLEYPQAVIVISINGSGVMSILDVEKKEILCEKRVLLNRISVRENVSYYLKTLNAPGSTGTDTSNMGSVRASLTKLVVVLSKEHDLIGITVGNEWSIMSLKELKEWNLVNSNKLQV